MLTKRELTVATLPSSSTHVMSSINFSAPTQCYIVGGFVRDGLLGIAQNDRDYVVCGSNQQAMLAKGFIQVGKSFQVFLHPDTKEEYALARLETKTHAGHQGFETSTDNVRLEQDLVRRDLTINAMAMDDTGNIIDPYGGWRDLQGRLLRHISQAFSEDPLRVLRVARFAARLAPLGFRVAPSTIELMVKVSQSGELHSVSGERIWQETTKALLSEWPSVYFHTLRRCGALAIIFPEVAALFGIPQTQQYHPEIDTGIHTMMVVDKAAQMQCSLSERFASLTHDLGKALTPKHILPSHRGHEKRGVALVRDLCRRLKVPAHIQLFAVRCAAEHLHCHRALALKASTIVDLITRLDGWRNPCNVKAFTQVCQADARGRLHFENSDYPQANYLQQCHAQAQAVEVAQVIAGIDDNRAKSVAIRRARIQAIAQVSKPYITG